MRSFVGRPQRGGPVVVISDLYDIEGWSRGLDLLQFHGYDPRLVQVVDPADAETTLLGDVELIDAESQNSFRATVTERTVRRYKQLLAAFHESVRDYCRRKAIAHIVVACDMPDDEVYRRVLGCYRTADATMQEAILS